jgi:hypothetical protein
MNDELNRKLSVIIAKRKENLVNIVQFDELFFVFAKKTLKGVTQFINDKLEGPTQDFLKIYYDDPLSFMNTQYFVQIQLSGGFSKNRYNLINEETNPVIKFEGDETNGQVKVYQKLKGEKDFKEIGKYAINQLNKEKTTEILIDFLDIVFS